MAAGTFFRSFLAGELSPVISSRADLPVYGAGARTVRNFLIGRHGGAINRPGTVFIGQVKQADANVRLVEYVHELDGESILIEMGVNYFRFYLNGTLIAILPGDFPTYDNSEAYTPGRVVTSGGQYFIAIADTTGNATSDTDFWTELTALDDDGNVIYEVPSPIDFPLETKWAQSGRVITFVHQSMRPRDLEYIASDEWRLTEVSTVSGAGIPQNPVVTQAPNEVSITYEVRAVLGVDAGPLSTAFTDTFAPPSADSPITLTWDPGMSGADYYEVFKNGQFLGAPSSPTFDDVGQALGDPWSPGTGGGTVDPPENLDATQPVVVPDTSTFRYVATAVVAGEESFASDVATDDLEDPTADRPHAIATDPVTDATAYNWFADPNNNGVFGFIGTTAGETFAYDGTPAPDYGHQPPTDSNFFGTSDFPAAVGFYGQRRLFGNKPSAPDGVQGSRVGLPSNFTVSTPIVDSDAFSFRLAGRQQHAVLELVGVNDLVVLTNGGEWRSRTAPNEPLTPFNLPFKEDTYVGAARAPRPCVIGSALVYVQARGRKVVEARFKQENEGLANRDLTIYASHLFDTYTLAALDYQYEPHSIVWTVRSDGSLLGVTYIEGADVVGWHRHDTNGGAFEDVRVVPELNEDVVYTIVKRTIDGSEVRYIERLANRAAALTFLDAAVEYNGVAITTLTGLDHLEGETVGIYAGGLYRGTADVAGGAIALGGSYTSVVAGLPIEADLETLDLDAAGTDVREKKKRVVSAGILVDASVRNFQLGPSASKLMRLPASTSLFSGYVEMSIKSTHELPGRVFIRHDRPTALTVLGVLPRLDVGV